MFLHLLPTIWFRIPPRLLPSGWIRLDGTAQPARWPYWTRERQSTACLPAHKPQRGQGDVAYPSGAHILAVIAECKASPTAKVDYVAKDVGLIQQDLDKFQA